MDYRDSLTRILNNKQYNEMSDIKAIKPVCDCLFEGGLVGRRDTLAILVSMPTVWEGRRKRGGCIALKGAERDEEGERGMKERGCIALKGAERDEEGGERGEGEGVHRTKGR